MSNGKIELVAEKGKARRHDLKYYPCWSWVITNRTKGWEEEKLIEAYKPKENQVIITPRWTEIVEALKETIKHELKVDTAIPKRKPDTRRYMSALKEIDAIVKKLETTIDDFKLDEIYTEALK